MAKIIHLSEQIIAKIAAGEVIERPAYAVKELIENAIDAGADVITVTIEDSGLRRIQIRDNGVGMSEEDLKISFLPHTTSKLSEEELIGIKTLGFRGEALSSIASISHMNIQSRTADMPGGTIISIHDGRLQDIMPIGTPVGTIVTVDNLFSSVPARKWFLKSSQTEFRHISDMVLSFALSYPAIHFTLTHNKKVIFDLPKKAGTVDRVKLLLGSSLFEKLIPFSYEEGYIKMRGFIGHPQIASKQKNKQFLFVNGRYVSDRIISLAVREAFGTLLPASATPIFLIHLSLPYETVDVNVHPKKEHIAFVDNALLFSTTKLAITKTLNDQNLTFRLAKFTDENSARIGETTSFSGQLLKSAVLGKQDTMSIGTNPGLLQLANTYILSQSSKGFTIYDQHAAHERILFELFSESFSEKKHGANMFTLPNPFTIALSLSEKQIWEEHSQLLKTYGITLLPSSDNTFTIASVPVVFRGRNIERIVHEVLGDLSEGLGLPSVDMKSQRMLAFLSCRAAVKAGDKLTKDQMKSILKGLEKAENNTTCPHGRPTHFALTLGELNQFFKRT